MAPTGVLTAHGSVLDVKTTSVLATTPHAEPAGVVVVGLDVAEPVVVGPVAVVVADRKLADESHEATKDTATGAASAVSSHPSTRHVRSDAVR
jgi:hypothetical protein